MKILIIIGIVFLALLNLGMLYQYYINADYSAVAWWKHFFSIRNIFGKFYGILLLLLCLPSFVIFYAIMWVVVGVLVVGFFGIKKEYKVLPKHSGSEEEENIDE